MNAEKARYEFEAWWRRTMNVDVMPLERTEYPMTPDSEQQYKCHETNLGWWAWQASRAAAAVELPMGEVENGFIHINPVRDAIRSAGLKVSTK